MPIPTPPADLIYLVSGHREIDNFLASRESAIDTVLGLMGSRPLDTVLDWGCGCGRLLAGWDGRAPKQLHGCDVNSLPVAWCQENIPYADVRQCGPFPPLPYEDETFDLIYAASVYTHLTLPAMLQWAGELARVIKPGGVAMVSIDGYHYWSDLGAASPAGLKLLFERGYHVMLYTDPKLTFKGSNDYTTYATPEFITRIFAGFKLVYRHDGHVDGPTHFAAYQDILLFERV